MLMMVWYVTSACLRYCSELWLKEMAITLFNCNLKLLQFKCATLSWLQRESYAQFLFIITMRSDQVC